MSGTVASLTITKARSGKGKILVVRSTPGTFGPALQELILGLDAVLFPIHNDEITANDSGMVVRLRVDVDAPAEQIAEAVEQAACAIAKLMSKGPDDYVLEPEEIPWRGGSPTR